MITREQAIKAQLELDEASKAALLSFWRTETTGNEMHDPANRYHSTKLFESLSKALAVLGYTMTPAPTQEAQP